METYSHAKVGELMAKDLDGYILKRASPSCGMERVKVFRQGGDAVEGRRRYFCSRAA